MKKCSAKAFAMCPDRAVCGSLNDAVYMEGSDCEKFNEAALLLPWLQCMIDYLREKYNGKTDI